MYDLTNYDKFRHDRKISNAVPFEPKILDKKAMLKRIDGVSKNKKLLNIPKSGDKLKT